MDAGWIDYIYIVAALGLVTVVVWLYRRNPLPLQYSVCGCSDDVHDDPACPYFGMTDE